jgi:hypothetical protein
MQERAGRPREEKEQKRVFSKIGHGQDLEDASKQQCNLVKRRWQSFDDLETLQVLKPAPTFRVASHRTLQ